MPMDLHVAMAAEQHRDEGWWQEPHVLFQAGVTFITTRHHSGHLHGLCVDRVFLRVLLDIYVSMRNTLHCSFTDIVLMKMHLSEKSVMHSAVLWFASNESSKLAGNNRAIGNRS